MKTSTQALSHARKLGLAALVGSAAAVAFAAVVLPASVAGVLPAITLAIPFLAGGLVEDALDHGASHA
jgi:hypothetical protein